MKRPVLLLYACAILVLFTLYAAQPIQPLFKEQFALSDLQAVIFTTVIMLPLGVAPILYGYILENFSQKRMLRMSIFLLGILEIAFAFSDSYGALIGIRAVQGLLIPAALTSLISRVSVSSSAADMQSALGNYVGITIAGGFLGRFLSGLSSEYFGWRAFFLLIGAGLVGLSFFVARIGDDGKSGFGKPTGREIAAILRVRHNALICAAILCVFFVFQGLLNFLPFELKNIDATTSGGKTGLMYAGYVIGIVTALNVTRVIRFFGSESRAMIAGILIYIAGLQIFHIRSFTIMFFSMFVFCLGMFMVHSLAAGYINKLAGTRKSITNGLYLSFYYAGGTLGTFLPGIFYHRWGWRAFVAVLTFALLLALAFITRLAGAEDRKQKTED
ncbi:MAG: MFS transporter [Zoogloeaceae bacterium]|jgi:YNFM family putative membrane transporter|nr:MFS transporter [Zoogloeaceae bacterium]